MSRGRCKCPLLPRGGHSGRAGTTESANKDISIALGRAALVTLEASSGCSQALCFFVKSVNFLVEPCHLGLRRIRAAQLFERLTDGELRGFSHGNRFRHSLLRREASKPNSRPRKYRTAPSWSAGITALARSTFISEALRQIFRQ